MEETKYEDALAELELIAKNMERGDYDSDEIASKLRRAQSLIHLCKQRLAKVEGDINAILNEPETEE